MKIYGIKTDNDETTIKTSKGTSTWCTEDVVSGGFFDSLFSEAEEAEVNKAINCAYTNYARKRVRDFLANDEFAKYIPKKKIMSYLIEKDIIFTNFSGLNEIINDFKSRELK